MGGFDTLALGSKILFGDNWFSDFNAALHESSIYNVAQTTIASVAVFTGGMNSGFNKAANSAGVKPSCFVAGTLVMAVVGMVAIEKIKSGDKIISTDPETMETGEKVTGITVMIDGKLKQVFDVMIKKSGGEKSYLEMLQEVLVMGIDEYIKRLK